MGQTIRADTKTQARLEDPYALLLSRLIVARGLDQAGPEAGAHGGELGAQRVRQAQRLLVRVDQRLHLGADETIGDDLLEAAVDQCQTGAIQVEIRLRG